MDADAILALSPEERLDLIDRLWDSLEEVDAGVLAAQRAELDRRLETLEADIADGVSWKDLKAELSRRRQ